jgi:predicted enzyme related to lactoylglutathione lyase
MSDNPLARHGKIAYVEIPARDATVSAAFYEAVFGFSVRQGTPDRVSFEDGPSHLIGAFTRQRTVSDGPGVMPWIYVTSVTETLESIGRHGGQVGQQPTPEGDTLLATFRDPAGNLIGVWQFIEPT